jgi:hypothetical protein
MPSAESLDDTALQAARLYCREIATFPFARQQLVLNTH